MAIWNPAPVAQWITERKRSKLFWNAFLGIMMTIYTLYIFYGAYTFYDQTYLSYQEETFIEGGKDFLITDRNFYDLRDPEKQNIRLSRYIGIINTGDKITVGVGKLSGELIEAKYKDDLVYEIIKGEIIGYLFLLFVVLLPLIGLCIFMLYVVNAKNPSKRIDKIKSQFVT